MDVKPPLLALFQRHKEKDWKENTKIIKASRLGNFLAMILFIGLCCSFGIVSTGIFGLRHSGKVRRKGERETGAELWSEKCRKFALLLKLTQKMTQQFISTNPIPIKLNEVYIISHFKKI
jgi:hypothetical protein